MAVYLPIWQIIILCVALPLVAFFIGILFSSLLRKFTARLQGRTGPYYIVPKSLRPVVGASRILQPFWDIMKLMYKQTIIPATAHKKVFTAAPFFASACVIIALWFLPIIGITPFGPFEFSLIVVLYMMVAIPISVVISGATSSSPWGAMGSLREVMMVLAYEIPFLFSIFSVALMTGLITPTYGGIPILDGSLSLQDIVQFQGAHYISFFGFNVPAWFLILNPFAAVAVMMSLIGKLQIKPMDIPEAEVEIIAGAYTEYSGKLLGVYEIVKMLLLFLSITLFIDMFLGGALITVDYFGVPWFIWSGILFGVMAIILVLILSVVNASNARFRADQAFKWYMKLPLVLSLIGFAWPYIIAALGGIGINVGIILV
ncbi:MAG: complex I subunit 1 family protein [Candidatus Odinarchaeia archaeon]